MAEYPSDQPIDPKLRTFIDAVILPALLDAMFPTTAKEPSQRQRGAANADLPERLLQRIH